MSEQQPAEHHDLIDEPTLPRFGLSVGSLSAIFVGGALGTLARYVFDTALPVSNGHFPWATLLINLSGSFLIGLLVPLTEHLTERFQEIRPLIMIGVLGGWTTYSTLAVDAEQLFQNGHPGSALTYLVATLFGGITLVLLGNSAGHRVVPP